MPETFYIKIFYCIPIANMFLDASHFEKHRKCNFLM